MDDVEKLARAYCRERIPPVDPDRRGIIADGLFYHRENGAEFAWQYFAEAAKDKLAWARAMEAVKPTSDPAA